LVCALAAAGRAADSPASIELSPEIEVTTAGAAPAVDLAANGNGLVAWLDQGVRASTLSVNGDIGTPRQYRQTSRDLDSLQVGASDSGRFVLVWQEADSEDRHHLFSLRLRADGQAGGGSLREFAQLQDAASVALGVAPDGRFGVLFTDERQLPDGEPSATARLGRFAADGRPLGPPVRLAGGKEALSARRLAAGGVAAQAGMLVAGWSATSSCAGEEGGERRAAVARLGWEGASPSTVAQFADGRDCDGGPRLAALLPSDVGALAILAGHNRNLQRFDAATGLPRGPRTVFAGGEEAPCPAAGACRTLAAAAGDARGRFAVVWEEELDGEHALTVQLFGRQGEARSEVVLISDRTTRRAMHPAAALAANGTLVVVWEQAANLELQPAIHLRRIRFD
jgi:hypothetical protein